MRKIFQLVQFPTPWAHSIPDTLEAAGDIISSRFVAPFVLNKHVQFHDPSLNRSREIRPEAVGGGIFDCVFPITSDRM